ncbi:acyl-CoA-like ligand-binding transcription factor [Streptomyces decoyicus]|uniref:acyl-CoA-like ligand-binding transcription factor n=1 Tax=Streptomyces decoyicus TaxID=249567 RepID=UPI003814C422
MTSDRTPDDTADGPPPGLRERKKRATREALSLAAVRLVTERGLEHVRSEDIAAAAGVSPRTFNNYFSSKYEAIASRNVDRARMAARALAARPRDEPLWEAIVRAVVSPLEGAEGPERAPDPGTLAALRRMSEEPALLGEVLKAGLAADSALAAAVAARTGTDAERDLYPRLVAGAVTSAVHVSLDQWLRSDPPVPLLPLMTEALRQLAAGLPDPSRSDR